MQLEEARKFVKELYAIAFDRAPGNVELDIYLPQLLNDTLSPARFVELCRTSHEFKVRAAVSSRFPAGHYHSPVVDPVTVRKYVDRERESARDGFAGISIDLERMRSLWLTHLPFLQRAPLGELPNGNERYGYGAGPFPEGDAISLHLMMAEYRPKHVVEVGSGYSTACLLDAAERLELTGLKLTCIDPHPERLKSLLRDGDDVAIIDRPVQDVDRSIVDVLGANDILFIDSTHVYENRKRRPLRILSSITETSSWCCRPLP